jgi:cytochrome c553
MAAELSVLPRSSRPGRRLRKSGVDLIRALRARGLRCLALLIAGLLAIIASGDAAAADAAAGRKKAARCQACHGLDGIAKMPNVPHIGGESELYLAKQLRAFRGGERKDPQMSLMAKNLSDEDIADLAAYFSRIEITARIPESLR